MPGNFVKILSAQRGISLIELVIFIVIVSVALTGITLIYLNATRYSADPMVRIRSIELAQSTLEEILLKAYDHSTPVGGGCVDSLPSTNCTSGPNGTTSLGPDGAETRALYNDVDDYNNQLYCGDNVVPANTACSSLACQDLQDESGIDISDKYAGYSVCVLVSFAGGAVEEINNTSGGITVVTNDAKRIDAIVTDPLGSQIKLSAYRLNF